ncbi:MAG TPA: hypothetical protein VJT71_07120 [Pyrinomonadaceae bacterium]|nr:hypothetical protein [Pyrinomonadaceae bacterium]
MKSYGMATFVVLLVLLGGAVHSCAQSLSPAEEAQQLRNDLRQRLDHQTEIEMRLHELDYELKPENIERYFSGVGSTRPEELREMRRKTLQAEKDRLQTQLSEIREDRSRLEAAIISAETRANYVAAMSNSAAPKQNRLSPLAGLITGRSRQVTAIAFAVILVGAIVALVRNRHRFETR